ncbi:MAG TPA: preprotein translocase subunit SecY [Ktedonobacterales bacterium]|nr:preprotein translocase subunit SecY [Ktedonobacterales bacterium]
MLNRLRSIWTIPDLRNKILFTIAMLLVFRLVAYVPVPGIDPSALSNANSSNTGDLKQFFGLLDVFTGGSLYTFGIASMGVYPYITASIVVQLLQGIVPKLGAMQREGEAGRNRLAQITRYITVPLALLQAFGQMALLVQLGAIQPSQFNLFNGGSFVPTLSALVSLTAGTMFLVWIGELITENGIGNGISLIIFANIMVRIPQQIGSQLISNSGGAGSGLSTGGAIGILFIVALGLAMTFVMVMVYLAQRRIPVQYPSKRRVFAMERAGQETTYIPMQVNSAGMIPIIFASSMLLLPVIIANFMQTSTNTGLHNFFTTIRTWLDTTNWWYWVIFGLMVGLFTFFYATVLWEQQNLAENLQKQGAFITGIRPGARTNEYLTRVMHRLTFGGAIFLGIVAVAPALISTNQNNLPFQAASLLIIVGVALDTIKQLEAQMVMRNYSGFLS